MKTKLSLTLLLSLVFSQLSSQVPQGFNYQAVARNASGLPIINQALPVRMTIQSDSLGGTIVWQELHSSVITTDQGVINLIIGKGTRQSSSTVATFNAIDWSVNPKFLKIEMDYSGWKTLGVSRLWSVPYAMVAGDLSGSVKKLSVEGETLGLEEALFEVKNKDGQTVFAVYNEGVRIYVSDGAKAVKGGFAVGGFGTDKAESTKYLFVGKDSVRVYLDTNPLTKKLKGGFAVGGYDLTKGTVQDYLDVNSDSVRIYIDSDPSTKGLKGGFAVGGYDMTKGTNTNYMNVNTDASGIINPSQNRILWYPLKNAFLTGRVLVENKDSVGENSFASGYESKAKGQYSQAMGYQAIARGQYSTSIGYQAVANKDNSFAFGQWAQARSLESYAFGRGAIAEGFRSFAFGSAGVDSLGEKTGVAYAKGDYSFALGQGSQALGGSSFAIGIADTAYGWGATAMGYKTTAKGGSSTSIGSYSVASGADAFAGGYQSQATNFHSLAFGKNTLASGHASVAMGTDTRSTGTETFALGRSTIAELGFSVAFGFETQATNYCAMSIGSETVASGGDAFAGGSQSQATDFHAFAFGKNTLASGQASVAMGVKTTAMGFASFAMGDSAIAEMGHSVAFGYHTLANDYSSLAGGDQSQATGNHAFAFGRKTLAHGPGSVALGDETKATNGDAFSMGFQSQANAAYSAVFGNGTISNSYASVVLGRFNDTTGMTNKNWYVSTDPAFEIGNGTSNIDRKNAFTVLQNSNVGINMANPQQKLDIAGGNGRVETGYNWLTNSDVRFKKNIFTLEGCLGKVMAMRGVCFDLINQDSVNGVSWKNIGFIAQELETVVPEVVVTGPDGYKSVAYDKITTVLTEAIKEQQQQIESYKSQLQSLQEEVELIKTLLAKSEVK